MKKCLKAILRSCKCKSIYFFDLVHDNVKTRILAPLSIVCIIFILVSAIFSDSYLAEPYPENFKIIIPPPNFLEIGEEARRFVAKVLNQYINPMEGIEIQI